MAFLVKKSMAFLISFALIICCSYANDHIFHQVWNGDRKLNELRNMGQAFVTKSSEAFGKVKDAVSGHADLAAKPLVIGSEKAVEFGAQKVGENIAAKFFGENGRKGFRIGCKAGKKYYAVEKKCNAFRSHLECGPPCTSCDTYNTVYPYSCIGHCVVEITESVVSSCSEHCGLPQFPCVYQPNGVVTYLGEPLPVTNIQNICVATLD